ncbi:unnamed protein product [Nippostrongylus brasiliensis]|uniref:Saposin B-type domain-containing protein n=1 Tax=Nippostrongylus brasiliensis TaxID=27835 RepID=A0A0N4YPJ4_NIPBR|nr:hypothetical protein Q1695_002424 [Nippostrongylus brasiliensis]VDL82895.1 unnamed protein product [Nippostrongylus brasiliensis]
MRSLILLCLLAAVCTAVVLPPLRTNVAECVMCKLAVKIVAPRVGMDVEDIEKDFDKECQKELKIPVENKECEKYINEHLDPIIHELESGTAPADVCKKLHGC